MTCERTVAVPLTVWLERLNDMTSVRHAVRCLAQIQTFTRFSLYDVPVVRLLVTTLKARGQVGIDGRVYSASLSYAPGPLLGRAPSRDGEVPHPPARRAHAL